MYHPENNALLKAQALKNLNRPVHSPDAALAVGAAENLVPQVLAFVLSGQLVQEVKAENLANVPVEKGLANDFSGAVLSPDAYNLTDENDSLYLGSYAGGV